MNPILAHPSAKSITLTLSSKCLDPVMMRIATLLLTGQHWCAAPVAAPKPSHYAVGLSPWPSPFLTVLRLVLGGHSRAPQPYGPRLCAQHQSLRPSHLPTLWDYPLAFALSYRAAAGPRRTQPRSTALRTATVCAAPVAALRPFHYVVGLSPGLRPFLPCCGWSSADTTALHSLTDRDCVRSTSRCAQAISLRRGTIPWPSPFLTVLRLVLGGHSRAPQIRGHSRRALRNPCNQIFPVVF
jgi:hypothetical protein